MTPSTTPITRRAPRFPRLLGLMVLVAVSGGVLVGRAPVASAAVSWNGPSMNGMPFNGIPWNGMPKNGMPYNGTPIQGMPYNGANLNGTPLRRCGPEATQRASEQPPPTHRLPWHRISHTALGQR